MNLLIHNLIRVRESLRAQTMTEYALMLAAIAVVVFVSYEFMGQDLDGLVNRIDSVMAVAAS